MRISLLRLYLRPEGLWIAIAIAAVSTALSFGLVDTRGLTTSRWESYLVTAPIGVGALAAWLIGLRFVDWSVRCSELEALLPVPARETRLVKTLAITCFLVGPVLASVAVVAAISLAKGLPPDVLRHGSSLALSVTGCVVLAVAVRSWLWPREPSRLAQLGLTVLLPALAIAGFLLPDPLVGATALLSGLLLGVATYRTGPTAAPLAVARTREPRPGPRGSRVSPLTRIVVRRVVFGWRSALVLALLFVFGINGVALGNNLYVLLVLTNVMMTAELGLQLLRVLGHLPIRRQRLFPWLILPPLCAVSLGTLVGFAITTEDRSGPLIELEQRHESSGATTYELHVAEDLWRIAVDQPPLVTAPTGETHRSTAYPIGPGSTFVRYNPYEVGNRPDGEFLAYQVSRVLKDCCGIALSPDETRRRYRTDSWKRRIYSWDVRDHHAPRGASDLAFTLLATVLSSQLVLLCVFHRSRPSRDRREALWMGLSRWLVPGLVAAATIAIAFGLRRPRIVEDDAPVLWPLWNLVRTAFDEHAVGATLAGVGLAVALWFVLQRRFLAMDPPGPARAPIPDSSFVDV